MTPEPIDAAPDRAESGGPANESGMNVKDTRQDQARDLTSRQMAWFRFSRNPSAVIGGLIVLSVILAALFAPWLAPSPESAGNHVDFRNRHAPPSAEFLLGTDNVGRDILSRRAHG